MVVDDGDVDPSSRLRRDHVRRMLQVRQTRRPVDGRSSCRSGSRTPVGDVVINLAGRSDCDEFIAREHRVPCVIAGFEPVDVLQAVHMLLTQVAQGHAEVEIEYARVVTPDGNPRARAIVGEVFEIADARWRGLGEVAGSGLAFRAELTDFDARRRFDVSPAPAVEPAGCRCGEVLRGVIQPQECELFARRCTPRDPVGACMVSSEGACAAHYRYRGAGSAP
jgi:hydrogenase expression/formation protein HypD